MVFQRLFESDGDYVVPGALATVYQTKVTALGIDYAKSEIVIMTDSTERALKTAKKFQQSKLWQNTIM